MSERKPYGARRLKAKVLSIINHRIAVCVAAEARYEAMIADNGGILGSVEIARLSQATERSARMEAELLRNSIAELPAAGSKERADA